MRWKKLSNIFCPADNYSWMVSHAANRFAEHVSGSVFRIYFTCRDKENRSHIASLEMDMDNFSICNISENPIVAPGEPGMFDDSGAAMGYLLHQNNEKYLYYLGWNLKVTVPWLNAIGLAKWDEQKKVFSKVSRAPVIDRSDEDPFTISYPSVLVENGTFRMWYGSNLQWGKTQESMKHVIKYAESINGIVWMRTNEIQIDLSPNEYALAKPFVIKDNGMYKIGYIAPW